MLKEAHASATKSHHNVFSRTLPPFTVGLFVRGGHSAARPITSPIRKQKDPTPALLLAMLYNVHPIGPLENASLGKRPCRQMLLKHPSSYKHQVAFTFPSTARELYERTRNLLLHDQEFDRGIIEFSLTNSENIFCENDWHTKTPREFYDAYRNSVLIVVLFDKHYMSSGGTYPEWKIVQELKTQLHRRVMPVKLGFGPNAPIDEPNLFCGCVDLSPEGMSQDDQAALIRSKVVTQWKKTVARWEPPSDHLLICFGDAPVLRNRHVDIFSLPPLCPENTGKIIGKIETGELFARLPKRSVCVVAPPECEREWQQFMRALALITHAYVGRRRSALPMPLFVPDGVDLRPSQSLREFVAKHFFWTPEARQAWELQSRLLSTLDDWLEGVGEREIANVIAASNTTFDDAVNFAAKYGNASRDAIVNLWRWSNGYFYETGSPFDLDLEALYYAADLERCNIIHLSSQLAEDLRKWRTTLGEETRDTQALQDAVFASLCDSRARWRPFLTTPLTQKEDRITLARLYCEAEPLRGAAGAVQP